MKKAELQKGKAYLVSSAGWRVNGWSESIFKVANDNDRLKKFVIFEGDEVSTQYGNKSMVYVTSCKTYGADCERHSGTYPSGLRRGCPREAVRLMDIKEEFYPAVQRIARTRREREADGGRGERYRRHLENKKKHDKELIAKPIRQEFYQVINDITGAGLTPYWSDLSRLNHEQMQKLIDAINAGRKVGA